MERVAICTVGAVLFTMVLEGRWMLGVVAKVKRKPSSQSLVGEGL